MGDFQMQERVRDEDRQNKLAELKAENERLRLSLMEIVWLADKGILHDVTADENFKNSRLIADAREALGDNVFTTEGILEGLKNTKHLFGDELVEALKKTRHYQENTSQEDGE